MGTPDGSATGFDEGRIDPALLAVLESAARLQEIVPDAVLVGGSAAALYAAHRISLDHDHVVADLRDRFDVILEAVEREGEWVTNRVRAGKIILGRLGDIETGVRQLIRAKPLETQSFTLPSGRKLRVPSAEETLRIKAFLIVKRNQVRDYLDVAALADRYGIGPSARVLASIDDYYSDQAGEGPAVASQLVRQLAAPRPRDGELIAQLERYKGVTRRWQHWEQVVAVCGDLAGHMVDEEWVE